jgi:lysophospholipase L1-like esterase
MRFAFILLCFATSVDAAEFELKDGDRVVWLGSTLIEREQRYGYWETALTARWPDRKITFRNLGWSGDNVWGEARLGFDINTPALGLKRMVDLTLAEKPTVIFICYGQNESFEGEAGLEKFEKGYEKLLDELKPAKARIVLMTPTAVFDRNEVYCDAVRRIGKKRELHVADLRDVMAHWAPDRPTPALTDNGIHLNEFGYKWSAALLLSTLGLGESAKDDPVLRQAIIEKNKLYFYRWRPQNETYLFGFRKKEQGQNAKEIAEFDPLIAKAEEEIARLKKTIK